MKVFKYGLALAILCATSIAHAASLNVINNTGIKIQVYANDQGYRYLQKGESTTLNVPGNLVGFGWSEYDRTDGIMAKWGASKVQVPDGQSGKVSIEKLGQYKWQSPTDAQLSDFKNGYNNYRNPGLLAKEGQAQLIDFIQSQPKNEQGCWVFALTLGSINPKAIGTAKSKCMEQTPENQKRLVEAQQAILQAKARGTQAAPMPADLQTIYDNIIFAMNNLGGLSPAMLYYTSQPSKEKLGPQEYPSVTALSVILGTAGGDTDPMTGAIRRNITQLVVSIALTVVSLGTATAITIPGIVMAVVETVVNVASMAAGLALEGIALQNQ